ncbi:MAG: WD40-repeat-containing domain protein [Linnemannia gamsii]|nr:MAG: WD40-repeat-containing domain protein [Linnemannia gamsii]
MDGVEFGELPYLIEGGEVRGCAYSPDKKSFATGSRDGTINIYDTTTWKRCTVLKGALSAAVNGLAFSHNSQQIAAAYGDGKVRIWGVRAGCMERVLESRSELVNCVAYSPNGQHIAFGSVDCSVIVWDSRTEELTYSSKGHSGSVNDVAFSPDGKEFVTASADNTVRLWRIGSSNESIIVGQHTSSVTSVAFSPSGLQVVSGSHDKTVRVWNLRSDEAGIVFKGHTGKVWSVAYSPDGCQIASGGQDCSIRLWNALTEGIPTVTLDGHTARVLCIRYSPSKNQIASTSSDSNVRLWNPSENSVTPCSPDVGSLAYSPDGALILSGSSNGALCFWDAQTGTPATTAGRSGTKICCHEGAVKKAMFSSDGSQIASCGGGEGGDGTVRIWDVQTGGLVRVLKGDSGAVLMVVFSPVGFQLASCSDDGTIRLWDTGTGLERALKGQLDKVHTIAYSPDGTQLAACSEDNIILWSSKTGARMIIIPRDPGDLGDALQEIAYSPDGQYIAATAASASKVNIWSCTTGVCGKPIQDPDGCRLFGVSYSPSGDLIATAASDKTLKLWDVESRECVLVLRGFSGLVTSVAWSPLPSSLSEEEPKPLFQRLVTGSTDRAIRQWEIVKHDNDVLEGEGKEGYNARLLWGSGRRGLSLDYARVFGARGVSQRNLELFRQRFALLL